MGQTDTNKKHYESIFKQCATEAPLSGKVLLITE